jgi:predicted DNA-binding transcriptional regulator YafY
MSDKAKRAKNSITIVYTNWRGETGERRIKPVKIWFGSTEWHKEEQWFLRAVDLDKNAERDFALKDIRAWAA